MVVLNKIFTLFLCAWLLCLNINNSYACSMQDNDLSTGKARATSSMLYAELPNLFNFTRPIKNQLKSIKNLSAFSLIDFGSLDRTNWKLSEVSHPSFGRDYIFYSSFIHIRLEIRTIIFPFHFFL
jgi:hypothetical protein